MFCSAVLLRSPLPKPNAVEIPSPYPPNLHSLTYEWFLPVYNSKLGNKMNIDLKPKIIIEGQPVTLKRKFAEIRRREDRQRQRQQYQLRLERDAKVWKERKEAREEALKNA